MRINNYLILTFSFHVNDHRRFVANKKKEDANKKS